MELKKMTLGPYVRHLELAHSSFGSPYKRGQRTHHLPCLPFIFLKQEDK